MPVTVRVVTTRDELAAAAGGDAFARLDPADRLLGWALGTPGDGAVAYVRTSARRPPSLTAWGPRVIELLTLLREEGVTRRHDIASISVPFDRRETVAGMFALGDGGDWEWMWTSTRPRIMPGEEHLVPLDDVADVADAARIEGFGRAQNPRFEGFPGTGHSEGWLAALDRDGALLACGAIQRLPSGVAHLGGIVVAVSARRRGFGRAISAALTRRAVATEGVCTLGMYSDNAPARALYSSLGYVTDKRWASRSLHYIACSKP